jgi:hypothetical protein
LQSTECRQVQSTAGLVAIAISPLAVSRALAPGWRHSSHRSIGRDSVACTLLSRAQAASAQSLRQKVFVLTLYNPFGGTGSGFEGVVDIGLLGADLMVDCTALSNPMNIGLNDLVAFTSGAFGAIVIDGYTVVGDNALALTHIGDPGFNIHPNDDGYATIAKAHRGADRGH